MAKKLTTKSEKDIVLEQIRKEQRRIQSFIKRKEKEGYTFDELKLPEIPTTRKRLSTIKETLKEFKSWKTPKLYAHAEYIDYSTGEILTGKEKQKLRKAELKAERHSKSFKEDIRRYREKYHPEYPSETMLGIQQLKDKLQSLMEENNYRNGIDRKPFFRKAYDMLNDTELSYDNANQFVKAIAPRLQDLNTALEQIGYYGEESAKVGLTRFATILKGSALTLDEAQELDYELVEMEYV